MYIDNHNGAFVKDDAIFKKLAVLMTLITVLIIPINLINALYNLATILILFLFAMWSLFFYYKRTKDFRRSSAGVLLIAAVDFVYMYYSGGTQGAGVLWTLTFPFLVFYFRSYRDTWHYLLPYYLVLGLVSVLGYLGLYVLQQPMYFTIIFFLVHFVLCVYLYIIFQNRAKLDERLYRSDLFYKHSLDLHCVTNQNETLLSINPAWEKVLGWSESELLGTRFVELLHPEDVGRTEDVHNQIVHGAVVYEFENRYRCKDGSYRRLSWRSFPGMQKGNVYAVARDVTDDREMMARVTRSESRFRLLIDSATVGIYEMVNRRIRVVNDTLLLWTGSERGDWKQLCLEYFIHPDHFVRLEKYIDEVRRNQNAGTSCELQLRRFDGSYIWVEHSCQVVYEQGEEVLIGTLHNVDERKNLEKEANYTSQLHRLLAETAFKFIQSDAKTFDSKIDVMLLTLGRVLNMDRSFVFRLGDDGDELTMTHEWKQSDSISVMKRFQQLRLQDFSDFKRLVINESIIIVEDVDTFVGSDSLKKWMNDDQSKSLLMVPILGHYKILGFIGLSISRNTRIFNDAEKDLLQVLGLMMADSIERIKMEKDLKNKADGLREINRTKDKLFSVIAHDLRSPFNTFIGFTDIMCDPEMSLSSDELRTYAHVLNQQAKSTLELLQNLLDWSRLQRGVIIPRPMDVSFEYFIGQQLFLFEDKLKNKSIVVESTIEIKETISIDVRILETLFRNLFSNAVKFTPQGGIIRIRISEEHSSLLLLSIEDTGIGIPSEIMSKLFIFDEHKGRNGTEGESSSGLGLMICQEFVEILSGRIWAESVVGKGSTFFVELPFRK